VTNVVATPAAPFSDLDDGIEGGAEGAVMIGKGALRGFRTVPRGGPHIYLEGMSLHEVRVGRMVLHQGERTAGVATFTPPPGSRYYLEAVAPPHSWTLWVGDKRDGRASFWLGCSRFRPQHVVSWTFFLRGPDDRRSNAIEVTVECTGRPAPSL
jgi:hypothetical protein